jgi:diketogulonate reductase-like aldo/keto reductase
LRDNLAAADWTLTSEEVAVLDRASQTATRYPNSHHRQHSLERNPQLFARYD